MRTASVLAGSAAQADFVGMVMESTDTSIAPEYIVAVNVYAQFNNPLDVCYAVAGTSNAPMDIRITGGTFYQDPFGNDLALESGVLQRFPQPRVRHVRHDRQEDVGR
jgi:hypothetical protein